MKKRVFSICLGLWLAGWLSAQSTSDHYLDVSVSPSAGFRILGAFNMPANYRGGKTNFRDSLQKTDRPGQSMNFGIQYTTRQNAFISFSFGLSYTTLTFRRTRENLQLGDEIHPKIGYITGFIQAAELKIKEDFRYHYAEVPLLWQKSVDKYNKFQDVDLFIFGGFAPAFCVADKVKIFTQGFTAQGKNTFYIRDDEIRPFRYNLIAQGGMRMHYAMYKKVHGLLQPRLRLPLLPSTRGAQSIWVPQLSLDLGLVFLLDKDKH